MFVAWNASYSATQLSSNALQPFTVRDSIEMTRVLNFSGIEVNAPGASVLFSPDSARFLLRIRRGDLQRNVNVESLLLFDTKEVAAYLATKHSGRRPLPLTVVQRDVTQDHGHLSHVQWVSNQEIGFIAESPAGHNQVFLASVGDGVEQLTNSATHVASFSVARDRVVYYSRVEAPTLPQVVAVNDQAILELLFWNRDPGATALQLFQVSRATGVTQRIDIPPMRLISASERIWTSPSGHFAVILAPSVDAPRHWADYQVPNYEVFGYTPEKVESDPTSWNLIDRTRYLLVDLRSGKARPLLDAPTGWSARNCTPLEVFWADAGDSVVVSNTFLPLDGALSPTEGRQRTQAPAIAQIDIASGAVTPIVFEPSCDQLADAGARPVVSVEWKSQPDSLTVSRRLADGRITRERFEKFGQRWRQAVVPKQQGDMIPVVERREALNERPRVFATGGRCACKKELFDPAPTADRLAFARTEAMQWKDRNGIEWQGGLILPPNHVPGRKYPLILQTHGFRLDEFLIDGAYGATTAMAAQALAGAGIAVLQIEDNRRADTPDEAALYAEGFRAAVDAAVVRGIADPANLGFVAFSRTGLPAIRMLADNPNLFAAVILADANWWGYLQDLLLLNSPQDAVTQVIQVTGQPPSPADLPEWLGRNPLYKLPQVRAAVRLEAINPSALIGNWEYFAILRKAERPVDLIYYPYGRHVLMKPAERLASQGGSVDWFRFWLQGYEDPDPLKTEQYQRWHQLRTLQRESTKAKPAVR